MKKNILLVTLISLFLAATAQAGVIFTNTKEPVTATSATRGVRLGDSTSTTFLWMITIGDASIDTAARKASITQISHVDKSQMAVLGIPGCCLFGTTTTEVYGQ